MPLSHFHLAVANWFTAHFTKPTEVQAQAWPAPEVLAQVIVELLEEFRSVEEVLYASNG